LAQRGDQAGVVLAIRPPIVVIFLGPVGDPSWVNGRHREWPGRADDVVPCADSEEMARSSGATLMEVGTDHRLADPEPLATMLKACEWRGQSGSHQS
jgi:hypothetical protein